MLICLIEFVILWVWRASSFSSELGSFIYHFFKYYFCSFVFLLLEFSICVCLYIWWSPAGLLYFVHFLSFVFFLFFRQDFTWAVSLLMSLHSMCLNLLLSPPSDFFSVVIMAFLNSRISISLSHIISIFICCYLFGEASSS